MCLKAIVQLVLSANGAMMHLTFVFCRVKCSGMLSTQYHFSTFGSADRLLYHFYIYIYIYCISEWYRFHLLAVKYGKRHQN